MVDFGRKEEEKFLVNKIFNKLSSLKALSCNEIIDYIYNKELLLEPLDEDGAKIIDDGVFDAIKKTLASLSKIVNKPRSFIKAYEEKVLVEKSKKINYKAIMVLSRDCNDWYARTALNVKPKYITSEINTETIDIYENRFVCSLIKVIKKKVVSRQIHFKNMQNVFLQERIINTMENEHYANSLFANYASIHNSISTEIIDEDRNKEIEDSLKECAEALKKINNLIDSKFFQLLRRKPNIHNPIQKTNILMFEHDYNEAYKLWYKLNDCSEEIFEIDKVNDCTLLENAYTMYVFLVVIYVLHELRFEEYTNEKVSIINNKIITNKILKFKNNKYGEINLLIDDNKLEFSYISSNNDIDKFEMETSYVDFELINFVQIEEFLNKKLNELSRKEKFSKISSRYLLVSLDSSMIFDKKNVSNKLLRRINNIGENYSSEENIDDLDRWGNYQTGTIVIRPNKWWKSFVRISKIINYHLLRDISFDDISSCPLCGGNHLRKENSTDYVCNDCFHRISMTYCNNCDSRHKKPILWIKYNNENYLKNDNIIQSNMDKSEYDKLSQIETIMRDKVVTSFSLQQDGGYWKLKTICPRCGKLLGN